MSPFPSSLLTLRLSSPSFLETILTHDTRPVYSTETNGNTTSLSRCDPYHGLTLIANINWPERSFPKGKGREFPPAQIFINGASVTEDELLKRNCLNTSRKFRVPGHSHSLKWRRVQGVFQCTSSSGTPVAVFEPPILTARARMNIFVPTLSGLPEPQGSPVSPILVDYLIVTALILLTHPEDWHGFAPSSSSTHTLPVLDISSSYYPVMSSQSTPVSPITSSFSDSSYQTSPQLASPTVTSSCWDHERVSSDSCHSQTPAVDITTQFKEDVIDYEPPPPYEEIQWTVRVRQPRRLQI
ncbi:hypothetical protein K439DRAFT_1629475 [Ramaria rubella]|nr:hypothetical protein K439DRAFT_1629475 [Ramaria rubella]